MKKKAVLIALCVILLGSVVFSWAMTYGMDDLATVPLGLCPVLVYALSGSPAGFILSLLGVLLIYLWLFFSIAAVARRRRFGTASLLIIMTVDLAANVVFTLMSWWYLLAAALDILVVVLGYILYRLGRDGL